MQATAQDAATSWGLRIPSVLELSRGSGVNGATVGVFAKPPTLHGYGRGARIASRQR
jgi:hypothetical protein